MHQGKYEEALGVLQDPGKGFGSPIGKSSWTLVLLLLELLGLCGQIERQWSLCQHILRGAISQTQQSNSDGDTINFGARGDDWTIWSTLISAADKMRTRNPE